MKKTILTAFLLILVMAVVPIIALNQIPTQKSGKAASSAPASSEQKSAAASSKKEIQPASSKKEDPVKPASSQASSAPQPVKADKQSFQVLDESTGEVTEISDKEFCIGALAAEMPPSFEKEALKAQAAALYTHFCRLREEERADPDEKLKGADFTCNSEKKQVYIPKDKMKALWKDQFDASYKKFQEAVEEVFAYTLTYDGKLINSVYCAVSGGVTESAKNAFGQEYPYLKSVASPWDALCDGYLSTVSFTQKEVEKIIKDKWKDAKLSSSPQEWFTDIKTTDAGTVSAVNIGSQSVTGQEVRDAFSLRSANFDVVYTLDAFVFTVRGYGHGAGMSQYGANEMAKQGFDYQEILSWYYPGTKLEQA